MASDGGGDHLLIAKPKLARTDLRYGSLDAHAKRSAEKTASDRGRPDIVIFHQPELGHVRIEPLELDGKVGARLVRGRGFLFDQVRLPGQIREGRIGSEALFDPARIVHFHSQKE